MTGVAAMQLAIVSETQAIIYDKVRGQSIPSYAFGLN